LLLGNPESTAKVPNHQSRISNQQCPFERKVPAWLHNFFGCTQCHKKYPAHHKLFDTLPDFSKMAPDDCPACGGTRELHVILDFQPGAGYGDFKVVSAFLPDKLESRPGDGSEEVRFKPFLVVLEGGAESKQFRWMPYCMSREKKPAPDSTPSAPIMRSSRA
jgi:hypothetical protein